MTRTARLPGLETIQRWGLIEDYQLANCGNARRTLMMTFQRKVVWKVTSSERRVWPGRAEGSFLVSITCVCRRATCASALFPWLDSRISPNTIELLVASKWLCMGLFHAGLMEFDEHGEIRFSRC